MAREGVVKALSAADQPIITVCAPAGYGKTTAVALWEDRDDRPFAWARLSLDDGNPAYFIDHLLTALNQTAPREDDRGNARLADLLAVVQAAAPRVLVLDDITNISSRSTDVVDQMTDTLPENSQLVLVGRSLHTLPLSRRRLAGDVADIGVDDLAMSDSEAAELLARCGVDAEQAGKLRELGDGWAAGLALLARGGGGTDHVTAYLEEEVLGGLSDSAVRFLERLAVLDGTHPEALEQLLQPDDPAKVFDDLQRAGPLPVTRTARSPQSGPPTFPIHPVLANVLRARMEHRDPEEARSLHRKASELCARGGDVRAAVQHAVDAGDVAHAADLVLEQVPQLLLAGEVDDLVDLLGCLGEDAEHLYPAAGLALGWCAIGVGDPPMLGRALTAIAGHLPSPDSPSHLTTAMAALRAMLAPDGLPGVLADTAAVRQAGNAASNPWWAVATFAEGATYYVLERDDLARARFASVYPLIADSPGLGAVTLSYMALLDLDADDVPTARQRLDDASVLLDRHRLDRAVLLVPAFAIGARVAALVGEPDIARVRITQAASMMARLDPLAPRSALLCGLCLGDASLHLGDIAAARQYVHYAVAARRRDDSATRLNRELDELLHRLESGTDLPGLDSDQLTPAELKVLAYLPTHLSLQGIADELVISRNTAKSHSVAIYRKLGVTKRSEAVEAARKLGILPAPST